MMPVFRGGHYCFRVIVRAGTGHFRESRRLRCVGAHLSGSPIQWVLCGLWKTSAVRALFGIRPEVRSVRGVLLYCVTDSPLGGKNWRKIAIAYPTENISPGAHLYTPDPPFVVVPECQTDVAVVSLLEEVVAPGEAKFRHP